MLFALVPAAVNVDALVTIGAVNALLWAMIAYENLFVYDERRYRLRHGLEIDIPGASTAHGTTRAQLPARRRRRRTDPDQLTATSGGFAVALCSWPGVV